MKMELIKRSVSNGLHGIIKMKKHYTLTLLVLCVFSVSVAFAGCSGQTAAEKNSIAFLEVLYNCPSEEYLDYLEKAKDFSTPEDRLNNPPPDIVEELLPYATEEHAKKLDIEYDLQLNCSEGGSSSVKKISIDEVKKGQLEATVDVVCTNPEGSKKELSLFILMNTDENDKVNFSRPPENYIEYQTAVTGKE